MDLEFVGVQSNGLGSPLDGKVNCDATLVGPWCLGLEIKERDLIVDRLDAKENIVLVLDHVCRSILFQGIRLTRPTGCPDRSPS